MQSHLHTYHFTCITVDVMMSVCMTAWYTCGVLSILYVMRSGQLPDVMELILTALQGVAPSLSIILWVHDSKFS